VYAIHSHYGILYGVGELSTYLCEMANFLSSTLVYEWVPPTRQREYINVYLYYQVEYYCILICKINIMLVIFL